MTDTTWPSDDLLRQMLCEGPDFWVAELLGVPVHQVKARRLTLNIDQFGRHGGQTYARIRPLWMARYKNWRTDPPPPQPEKEFFWQFGSRPPGSAWEDVGDVTLPRHVIAAMLREGRNRWVGDVLGAIEGETLSRLRSKLRAPAPWTNKPNTFIAVAQELFLERWRDWQERIPEPLLLQELERRIEARLAPSKGVGRGGLAPGAVLVAIRRLTEKRKRGPRLNELVAELKAPAELVEGRIIGLERQGIVARDEGSTYTLVEVSAPVNTYTLTPEQLAEVHAKYGPPGEKRTSQKIRELARQDRSNGLAGHQSGADQYRRTAEQMVEREKPAEEDDDMDERTQLLSKLFTDGYRPRQIAYALGIAEGTVASRKSHWERNGRPAPTIEIPAQVAQRLAEWKPKPKGPQKGTTIGLATPEPTPVPPTPPPAPPAPAPAASADDEPLPPGELPADAELWDHFNRGRSNVTLARQYGVTREEVAERRDRWLGAGMPRCARCGDSGTVLDGGALCTCVSGQTFAAERAEAVRANMIHTNSPRCPQCRDTGFISHGAAGGHPCTCVSGQQLTTVPELVVDHTKLAEPPELEEAPEPPAPPEPPTYVLSEGRLIPLPETGTEQISATAPQGPPQGQPHTLLIETRHTVEKGVLRGTTTVAELRDKLNALADRMPGGLVEIDLRYEGEVA